MTTTRRGRGLLVAAVAVVLCAGAAAPAAAEQATPRAEGVSTVFFGDSYTANFGIAPLQQVDSEEAYCFRAQENYPAVAARRLAAKGTALDIASDRSCGGALIEHFWTAQPLLGGIATRPPQQEALGTETKLVVGSLGGNTVGFANILKQCSQKLRDQGALLPADPVDADEPADQCAAFFTTGDGKDWLDYRFDKAQFELEQLLNRIYYAAPEATTVLVGYPRIVPANVARCQNPAPGQTEKPLADIDTGALLVFDKIQKRLNDLMRTKADENGAVFVDLYAATDDNTACDGADRGIGGLFENSQLQVFGTTLPWYLHPNTRGRDIQADQVATTIQNALNR
ncbi:SGNH/GDSL hydrolase family protein [Saccharothrix syringae]|uniref:SGNH/GDSL hydrolase family protein n=1 Tax=Saccharothrix syringae TaxID=103733 RepID=A0A5Q0GX43_SACSY|nr:SGNH/GDSL hydrolase family protein [Saccharothrix syringae]QFZ18676.1 SGNH/GDSL hydrolase family protein [Saccharothrix syringae]